MDSGVGRAQVGVMAIRMNKIIPNAEGGEERPWKEAWGKVKNWERMPPWQSSRSFSVFPTKL